MDDPLPQTIKDEFNNDIRDIPKVAEQKVPRYIFGRDNLGQLRNPPTIDEQEIHTFVDGGNIGRGCSAYIRFPVIPNENYDASLL